jgi:plasmid stability protein
MKRTTLALDPVLQRRLKEKAAREGRTLQEVANELLRQGLARQVRRGDYRLRLEGWEAEQQPGVDILDRDKLFDLMAAGS